MLNQAYDNKDGGGRNYNIMSAEKQCLLDLRKCFSRNRKQLYREEMVAFPREKGFQESIVN